MVKHTKTIRRQFGDEFLNVFDHFVKLPFKGLIIFLVNVYKYAEWSEFFHIH